ncbi:hypothetical protein FM120_29020 [Sphingobacterium faecium PCAi_F2.5]|nr:hypothetical protein FM120_29020 [Sphingobacterium faecium PCAi_F2.5]
MNGNQNIIYIHPKLNLMEVKLLKLRHRLNKTIACRIHNKKSTDR